MMMWRGDRATLLWWLLALPTLPAAVIDARSSCLYVGGMIMEMGESTKKMDHEEARRRRRRQAAQRWIDKNRERYKQIKAQYASRPEYLAHRRERYKMKACQDKVRSITCETDTTTK